MHSGVYEPASFKLDTMTHFILVLVTLAFYENFVTVLIHMDGCWCTVEAGNECHIESVNIQGR